MDKRGDFQPPTIQPSGTLYPVMYVASSEDAYRCSERWSRKAFRNVSRSRMRRPERRKGTIRHRRPALSGRSWYLLHCNHSVLRWRLQDPYSDLFVSAVDPNLQLVCTHQPNEEPPLVNMRPGVSICRCFHTRAASRELDCVHTLNDIG